MIAQYLTPAVCFASVRRPGSASAACSGGVFYVPQKPYTTIGTLREQVGLLTCSGKPKAICRTQSCHKLALIICLLLSCP